MCMCKLILLEVFPLGLFEIVPYSIFFFFFFFQADHIWIQGRGRLHAVHVNIKSENLTVDDLGLIKGDNHDIKCHEGQGFSGHVGSGKKCFLFDNDELLFFSSFY